MIGRPAAHRSHIRTTANTMYANAHIQKLNHEFRGLLGLNTRIPPRPRHGSLQYTRLRLPHHITKKSDGVCHGRRRPHDHRSPAEGRFRLTRQAAHAAYWANAPARPHKAPAT